MHSICRRSASPVDTSWKVSSLPANRGRTVICGTNSSILFFLNSVPSPHPLLPSLAISSPYHINSHISSNLLFFPLPPPSIIPFRFLQINNTFPNKICFYYSSNNQPRFQSTSATKQSQENGITCIRDVNTI